MKKPTDIRFESLEGRQLLSFGQPVQSFGVSGRALAAFDSGNATPVEMLANGSRIVIASDAGMMRFTTAGQIDTAFGTAGKVSLKGLDVRDIAYDSAGRIMMLAYNTSGSILLRFTSLGKSDKTFGTNGAVVVTSSKTFSPSALAVDSTGRFIVAGTIKTTDKNGFTTKVYRLTPAGVGDSTFSGDGVADLQLAATDPLNPTPYDVVTDVAVTTGDKIIVMGASQAFSPGGYDQESGHYFDPTYGDAEVVAAQFTADTGALDSGYGSGGFARSIFDTGKYLGLPQVAGKLISNGAVALGTVDTSGRTVIVQFDSSGALIRTDTGPSHSAIRTPRDIAQLGDGRLVVVADTTGSDEVVYTLDAGTFGPIIQANDAKGTPLFADQPPQVAIVNGDIVIGSRSYSAYSGDTLWQIDAGSASDKPDQFANGSVSDIARDAQGGVHLAYYDSSTTKLMYAYRDPIGVWTAPRTIDTGALTGQMLSIAVDAKNRPAIAYYDGTNADLKLAQYSGKTWTLSTLDAKGTTGQYPSIQFTDAGYPAISYYSRTTMDLKFVTYENKKWVYELVDSKGDVGKYDSLALTSKTRRASIAYTSSDGSVKYAVRTAAGSWTLSNVATTTGGAAYLDLQYGGYYSRGAISFYDANSADLKLAMYDGTKWTSRALATSGAQGLYTSVYAPYSSQLYVFSYNRSKDKLSVFTSQWDTTSTPSEGVIDTAYGKNASVAVNSSGEFVVAAYDSTSGKLHVTDGIIST